MLLVRGTDYDEPGSAQQPLWAPGAQLELAGAAADSWGWTVRAVAVVPLRRETFSVHPEEGTAFGTAPVAGWLGAGIWAKIW
jgi:hypothetical protein